MNPSNYPPGVTGNEPEITGEPPARENGFGTDDYDGSPVCPTCGGTHEPGSGDCTGAKPVPTPLPQDKVPTLAEQATEALGRRFGISHWHQTLVVNARAGSLYWLIYLAEQGIKARQAEMERDHHGRIKDVCDVVSLGSWHADVEGLVNQLASAKVLPPAKKAKPKKK
jgi:hypothetical protein